MEQSLHADLSYGSRKAALRGGLSRRKFGDWWAVIQQAGKPQRVTMNLIST